MTTFQKPGPPQVAGDVAPTASQDAFRNAMRQLAGGISVATVGEGDDRAGLTATSVTSLSVDPPTLLVCVNLSSSSLPLLDRYRRFGVNLLGHEHRAVADRFASRAGEKGLQEVRRCNLGHAGDWSARASRGARLAGLRGRRDHLPLLARDHHRPCCRGADR